MLYCYLPPHASLTLPTSTRLHLFCSPPFSPLSPPPSLSLTHTHTLSLIWQLLNIRKWTTLENTLWVMHQDTMRLDSDKPQLLKTTVQRWTHNVQTHMYVPTVCRGLTLCISTLLTTLVLPEGPGKTWMNPAISSFVSMVSVSQQINIYKHITALTFRPSTPFGRFTPRFALQNT